MRMQGAGGCIINIGTNLATSGLHGLPSIAPIAAKGGIMALTKNLSVFGARQEWTRSASEKRPSLRSRSGAG